MRSLAPVTVAILTVGCVHAIQRQSDQVLLAVTFQFEDFASYTFLSRPSSANPLPSLEALAVPDTGGGGIAVSAAPPGRSTHVAFLLSEEQRFGARISAVEGTKDRERLERSRTPRATNRLSRPCWSVSAFFIDGVGTRPTGSVSMRVFNSRGTDASTVLDPMAHMSYGRPVLSVTTKQVERLWTVGGKYSLLVKPLFYSDALVLAVLQKDDGTYFAWSFKASRESNGSASYFVAKAGRVAKWSIFVFADPREKQSPCRTPSGVVS